MSQSLKKEIPLVVDLDGTLIFTDLLYEGCISLIKRNPLLIFNCLVWLTKGIAFFKKKVFERAQIEYELLPYNQKLLSFLKKESENGRQLMLATASPLSCANEVKMVHPIFDFCFGTEKQNLKGENKLRVLVTHFGNAGFDYIGNSNSDLPIFRSSRFSYLVNPSSPLERKAKKIGNLRFVWKPSNRNFSDYLRAIRAYQWIKNLLIFVPLITSHSFSSTHIYISAVMAFLAFSFTASAGYVINDLLDLNSDRSHPRKKFRPFASGRLSIPTGIIMSIVLFISGIIIAFEINNRFILLLLGYFFTSLIYSLYFKRIILFDVFILAFLYSTRIIAGGIATEIIISFWLISFSTFIFLSLAFVKRCSELMRLNDGQDLKIRGREYRKEDLNLMQIMGVSSGFLSVVVFSLYINSPEVLQLYSRPKILWTISFAFLFWISHVWINTNRGNMTDDPIVYAIKDKFSYLTGLVIGLIIFFSV